MELLSYTSRAYAMNTAAGNVVCSVLSPLQTIPSHEQFRRDDHAAGLPRNGEHITCSKESRQHC